MRERLVNRLALQLLGNEERNQVRDHQRHDDGIVARQLEDHDHRSQRRPDDPGERGSHSNQCVRAGASGGSREDEMRDSSYRRANHRTDE